MRPLELLFFILAKINMATFCHMAMAIIFAACNLKYFAIWIPFVNISLLALTKAKM